MASIECFSTLSLLSFARSPIQFDAKKSTIDVFDDITIMLTSKITLWILLQPTT